MRLTLRQLQIFVAVAQTGSTTAAAESIAMSQSAISAALNELEAMLGGLLFDRVSRRLILNDHGRAMLPQARSVLDGAQGIEDQFGLAADSVAHLRMRRARRSATTRFRNSSPATAGTIPGARSTSRSATPSRSSKRSRISTSTSDSSKRPAARLACA